MVDAFGNYHDRGFLSTLLAACQIAFTNTPNQERGGIHGHQSESITDRSTDGRSDGRMD